MPETHPQREKSAKASGHSSFEDRDPLIQDLDTICFQAVHSLALNVIGIAHTI
jgi:hypothetical protein